MLVFSRNILENLAFKSLFCKLSGGAIGATEVLVSRTVLKICYRLSSKYITMENIAEDIAEGLGLGIKPRVESF